MNAKFQRNHLAAMIASYLSLGIGPPLQGSGALQAALQMNGNIPDVGSFNSVFGQALATIATGDQFPFTTSAAASATITAMQGAWYRFTNGGAVTVTLDAAYNVVNLISNPFVGMAFGMDISTNAATTIATPTLTGSSITLSGTTTLLAAAWRKYQCLITQVATTSGMPVTSGTTFTSLTQVGSTNRYTVVLGTNALVPTVGQAIYLGVTAGTLPAGWYPIDQVTSATSFVIAAPIAGTAWTATAATVPGTQTIPASQYTSGLQGIYSPLMTITGVAATVVNTMSV